MGKWERRITVGVLILNLSLVVLGVYFMKSLFWGNAIVSVILGYFLIREYHSFILVKIFRMHEMRITHDGTEFRAYTFDRDKI